MSESKTPSNFCDCHDCHTANCRQAIDTEFLLKERDQLKAEVEKWKKRLEYQSIELSFALQEVAEFKAGNHYQRGLKHGERDEKKRTYQWRDLAQDLAQELTDNLAPGLESPALERYDKLKEGKPEENDTGFKLRTRKGA